MAFFNNIAFFTNMAFFQATPRTEQVGIWGKPLTWHFSLTQHFFKRRATHTAGGDMDQNHYHGISTLTWHFFKRHHAQSRWGYEAKPLTLHFSLHDIFSSDEPLTEQVGIWSKATNMALLTNMAFFKRRATHRAGGDMGQNH